MNDPTEDDDNGVIDDDGNWIMQLAEVSQINDFKIYPTPARTDLQVSFNATIGETVTIRLMSIDGKEMFLRTMIIVQKNTHFTIPLNDMKSGIYIAELKTSRTTERAKMNIVK